jgi:hypothetical protein
VVDGLGEELLDVAGLVPPVGDAPMTRASHAVGWRQVWTPVLASHDARTAAKVRTVAAFAVVGVARRVAGDCSSCPSRVRSSGWDSPIALDRVYCPVRTASQISASAPAGTLARVMKRPSHARRTVCADRHAALLAMTSRRLCPLSLTPSSSSALVLAVVGPVLS